MAKKKIPKLVVEPVSERVNLGYMCMLEYKRETYLAIIDNITPAEIGAYVLDYADQENIPLQEFLSIVTKWFYGKSERSPLSVEIAQHGLTSQLAPLYRTFDTTYVTRIVGQAFSYDGMQKAKVRRRRVVAIPEGIEVKLKRAPNY